MGLTGKQRRYLRALGHHLHAVVQVGDAGVTDGVIAATAQALETHELVKVRIADDREGREAAIAQLAEGTGSEIAQVLGRTALLYKRRKKKPKIRFEGEVLPVEAPPRAAKKPVSRRTPRSRG
ncbi:MAG: ribosome assembly RNA-binding protein YhbY [Myxococcaceae bacterium]|nr:ribosome assembly RNA-binding protein YhbY [Myxococcaceae bacterium]